MTDTDRASAGGPATSAAAGGSGPARLFGLRRSATVEIALFITVVLLLDQIVFQGARYWDVAPHPFWILVVLISAQYGTNEGLVATLAASAALLVGNVPAQGIDQDLYAHVFDIARRPMMWLVTAVVVGEIRVRHLREHEKMLGEMQKATEGEERIAQAYTSTRIAKDKLEARVAGQLRTVLSTFRAAKAVKTLKPGEVLLGSLDLVDQALGPTKYSLFLLNNNVLEAAVQEGWQAGESFSTAISATSPLFQAVVGDRRFLCAADVEDEVLLEGEGLLAGPLADTDTGEVVGMLKLEDLDYYDLNLATVENFQAVCEWIGTALAHALQFERVESLSPIALSSKLFSDSHFERHASFLTALARRVGFPVALITLRLENPEHLGPQDMRAVPQAIYGAATDSLRDTDLCFERSGKHDYAIVLAGTARDEAQPIVDRLIPALDRELARTEAEARFTVALQELVPGRTDFPERSKTAFAALDRQVSFLTQLARRFQFDLNMVSLRLTGVEQLDSFRLASARSVVETSLAAGLKSMPLASYYPNTESTFAVLLPALPAGEVRGVANGLVGAINQALAAAGFEAEILAEVNLITEASLESAEPAAALAPRRAS